MLKYAVSQCPLETILMSLRIYKTLLNLYEYTRKKNSVGKFINFYLKESQMAPWRDYPILSTIHEVIPYDIILSFLTSLNVYLVFLKKVNYPFFASSAHLQCEIMDQLIVDTQLKNLKDRSLDIYCHSNTKKSLNRYSWKSGPLGLRYMMHYFVKLDI